MRIRKAIDVLCYLLYRVHKADKIKLVKLVYLADKYHLIHYGRLVTGDEYYAMENGPVASKVLDILDFDEGVLKDSYEYAAQRIKKVSDYEYEPGELCTNEPSKYLSKTDTEALDFIIETFGDKSQWDLRDYTHEYQEWRQHEDLLNAGFRRIPLKTEELLSVLKDDPIGASEEHIEESKKYLTGTYN